MAGLPCTHCHHKQLHIHINIKHTEANMPKTKVAPVKVSIPTVGATTTMKSVELSRLIESSKSGSRIVLTPALASEILAFNNNNRRVKKERVAQYSASMKRGQWQYTGDAIRIGKDEKGTDVLLDGQHRLLACVESRTSFETMVISGLPASVFMVIDRGVTRTNGDILRVAGFVDSTQLGSMVRPVIALDSGLNPMMHGTLALVTGDDMVRFCDENRELVNWAKALGDKGCKGVGGIKSAWGIFSIIAARVVGKKVVEQFIDECVKGVGLVHGDPRLALRSFMLKTGSAHGVTARNYRESGTIMRAFNAYLEGRTMSYVKQWGANSSATYPQTFTGPIHDWRNGAAIGGDDQE
jgi:hypothetical protein